MVLIYLCLSLLTAGLAIGWVEYLRITGNVHTVVPAVLYRSAQLDDTQLENVIRQNGINTVVNLRGAHPDTPWYDHEVATTARLGVQHVDFPLSATRPPKVGQFNEILDLLQTAPKPILVHCEGGADRSGIVAALYLYTVAHRPAEKAKAQLSFAYGHFPWLFWSRSGVLDRVFDQYVAVSRPAGALP